MKAEMAWLTRKLAGASAGILGRLIPEQRLARLKRDVAQLIRVEPLFTASNQNEYALATDRMQSMLASLDQAAEGVLERHRSADRFEVDRFCLCCNETMPMLVDARSGGFVASDGGLKPNWRERLVCRKCNLNNRQRLMAKLIQQVSSSSPRSVVYLMEQVTPIFKWVKQVEAIEAHGSEYLGFELPGGTVVDGVRHEDVMQLSYADATFDLIVSNDVLEHIPSPTRALQECYRVLKPGGTVLATFPFHVDFATSVVRARAVGAEVEFVLPPQYHGNPISSEGSLVFHDFGWDVLEHAREAGFAWAQCEVYGGDAFGHLGLGLLVFRMGKAGHPTGPPVPA